MAPSAKGTSKKVVSVNGRYWKSRKYVAFEGEPVPRDGFVSMVLNDGDMNMKDGLPEELFPLTSKRLEGYVFERGANRVVQGRAAYAVKFGPGKHHDYGWSGEAVVDKDEFQPISVYTRVDKDIWFPSSYGTEFDVKALFLINRTMTQSTENRKFKRVAVDSRVEFETMQAPPE